MTPSPPQQPILLPEEGMGHGDRFTPLLGSFAQFSYGHTTHKDMNMGTQLHPGHATEKLFQSLELE